MIYRFMLFLLLILVLLPFTFSASLYYQSKVQNDNPLLYYQFNEAQGPTVINHGSLGSGYNGVYNGTISRSVESVYGDTGVSFDASDDYIESNTAAPTSLTGNPTFSIETLVYIPTDAYTQNYAPFLHWGGAATAQSVYFSFRRSEENRIYAGFYNGGQMMSGTITLGGWHHIVMVREGGSTSNLGTTLYIDGVSVALTPDTALPAPILTPTLTSTTFRINRATDSTRYSTITMDEIALYGTALSGSQVLNHYDAITQAIPEVNSLLLLVLGLCSLLSLFKKQ